MHEYVTYVYMAMMDVSGTTTVTWLTAARGAVVQLAGKTPDSQSREPGFESLLITSIDAFKTCHKTHYLKQLLMYNRPHIGRVTITIV